MTLEKFNDLYLGNAVHCKTEELANEFLKLADSFGFIWNSNDRLTKLNNWGRYQDKTCYSIYSDKRVLYCSVDNEDLPIVEFEVESKITLEQLGFTREQDGNSVIYSRPTTITDEYVYIEFYLEHKEFELTNTSIIDTVLLEAIYTTAKELFK